MKIDLAPIGHESIPFPDVEAAALWLDAAYDLVLQPRDLSWARFMKWSPEGILYVVARYDESTKYLEVAEGVK